MLIPSYDPRWEAFNVTSLLARATWTRTTRAFRNLTRALSSFSLTPCPCRPCRARRHNPAPTAPAARGRGARAWARRAAERPTACARGGAPSAARALGGSALGSGAREAAVASGEALARLGSRRARAKPERVSHLLRSWTPPDFVEAWPMARARARGRGLDAVARRRQAAASAPSREHRTTGKDVRTNHLVLLRPMPRLRSIHKLSS